MTRIARSVLVAVLVCGQLALVAALGGASEEPVTSPVLHGLLERFPKAVAKRLGIPDLRTHSSAYGPNAVGTLVIDPGLDRGYQMWALDDPSTATQVATAIAEIDLATLRYGRIAKIPDRGLAIPGPGTVGTEFLTALDEKNHTLYLQTERGGGFVGAATTRPEIVALDLRRMTYTINEMPSLIETGLGATAVFGMEFDEIAENLILTVPALEGSPSSTANPVAIIGWPRTAFTGAPLPAAGAGMLGPRVLRNCRRDPVNAVPQNTDVMTPMMITTQRDPEANLELRTWFFTVCFTTTFSHNAAIIRLNHSTLFERNATDERLIPAPPAVTNWAVDEKRGRMLLTNDPEGTDGWVYEAASNAYIGVIQIAGNASGRTTGFGVHEGSGRLYAFNGFNGVMIAEMGQDPIPQADPYREFATVGGWPIRIDPKRDRIFVLAGTEERKPRYEVYQVPPPIPPPSKPDPDTLTQQVDEQAGKTVVQYGGSATAYGARTLLAGGFGGVIPTSGNDSVGRAIRDVNVRCGLRDREVVLASIPQTDLQSSAREAKALAVHLDNASVQDFGRPSRCDVYNELGLGFSLLGAEQVLEALQFSNLTRKMDETLPDPSPDDPEKGYAERIDEELSPTTKWQYTPATCATPTAIAGNNSDHVAGPTSVACATPRVVGASAEARLRSDTVGPLVMSIGRATATTKVWLDPALGLVSEAIAILENVKIGPVTIGSIENRARSYAKGRSGTARTDPYVPFVTGARGPGITGCEVRCDLDSLIPHLNTALTGRAEFRTLRPDATLRAGSPGGYQSGIIKSEKQRSSDNALVGDRSSEVPALEMIVYNDNPRLGRIRQVVQFAGVHVDSQYGIEVFGDLEPCLGCNVPPPVIEPPPPVIEPPPPPPTVVQPPPKVIRQIVGAVVDGFQVLVANPRQAGVVATVWGLLISPYLVWRRRRLLMGLGN